MSLNFAAKAGEPKRVLTGEVSLKAEPAGEGIRILPGWSANPTFEVATRALVGLLATLAGVCKDTTTSDEGKRALVAGAEYLNSESTSDATWAAPGCSVT